MRSDGSRRLGEALDALLRPKTVSIAHITRVAGVSRNTITALRRGRIHQPDPDLLRRIAEAFATDPETREVDEAKMNEVNAILNDAYGYASPEAQETKTLLELALYHHFKSLARAHAWEALFRSCEDLPISEVRALQRLAKPGC